MVHATAVDINEMRGKLLTLDDVRERLTVTEPGGERIFKATDVQMRYEPAWAAGDDETALAPAYLQFTGPDAPEIQLTKQAALELGAVCRMPREVQKDWPADLLQTVVNRSLSSLLGEKDLKLLVRKNGGADVGTAVCRPTVIPFSNLVMLDRILEGIEAAYGEGEVLADYKFYHDLEQTNLRLIVPGLQRVITGTRVADDTWSTGIDFRNSLIGLKQTSLGGYLFRWWCTNGCTDTLASVPALSRRETATAEDAYEWCRQSVDEVIGGLESALDAVQASVNVPVPPDQVAVTIRDLFEQHNVPVRERQRVVSELAELDEDMTIYDVSQAITVVANSDRVSPRAVEQLLSLGGHAIHAATERCEGCRRLLPAGFSAD